jgi:hypothetical protein
VTGEPYDVVFGVGFVPGRSNPQRMRVIKLQYDRNYFQPKHGLISCGTEELTIAGNAKVTGGLGHLHSNGTVKIIGGSTSVAQKLSAAVEVEGNANAGAVEYPSPEEFCPEVEASDFYGRAAPPYTCYEGDTSQACLNEPAFPGLDGRLVLWWDLCPDGTARKAGPSACTGDIVFQQGQGAANHRGWRWSSQQKEWRTQGIQSGVYYVYRSSVDVSGGGQATATILVEQQSTDAKTGNTDWSGNAKVRAALEELVLVTDRDLELRGTAGGIEVEGLFAVGEQAALTGTASVSGAVYVRDRPSMPGSPVHEHSSITGNFTIDYSTELDVPLLGVVRITHWNEQ